MNRRSVLALLLALASFGPASLLTPSAWAADGKDNEEEDDDDDEDDNEGGGTGSSGDSVDRQDDDALRAVNAKDAIPLKQMLALFAQQFDGTIVDVSLIRSTGALRYRVKFIDPAGHVRRAYFSAVTGALIH